MFGEQSDCRSVPILQAKTAWPSRGWTLLTSNRTHTQNSIGFNARPQACLGFISQPPQSHCSSAAPCATHGTTLPMAFRLLQPSGHQVQAAFALLATAPNYGGHPDRHTVGKAVETAKQARTPFSRRFHPV